MEEKQTKLRWRWGVLAGICLMLLALFPQFNLWHLRGHESKGAYAYNDIDEAAYAAYLQALIDGRPRRNDPYTGRDDAMNARQPESLFSIQFIPPYTLALLARPFGFSASTMMIVCGAFAAFATALALFWLLGNVTKDDRVATTGALVVLCLGTLACAQGAIVQILGRGWAYPYLPFLRRYVPALPFPLFFIFCALVWRSTRNEKRRGLYLSAIGAGLSFGVLVYSYFYLWTTALAWIICFALLMLMARPDGWKRDLKSLGVILGIAALALIPYALLLSHRSETMDSVQLLTLTHRPDILRPPFLIGLAMLLVLISAVKLKRLEFRDRRTLFAAAFALTPLVVFNQQVITGRSLQPIHYEVFIVNYVAAFAVVLTVALLWRTVSAPEKRKLTSKLLLSIALLSFGWGAVEADITTHVIDEQNIMRDEAVPVGLRLRALARETAQNGGDQHAVVYTPNLIAGDELPTLAPESVLWSRHLHIFSGTTWTENKERFYQQLYYANLDPYWLKTELEDSNHVVVIALFGWGRNQDRLTVNATPLAQTEIDDEVGRYTQYVKNFDRERATHPQLSYVVTDADSSFDFSKIDRWYTRDAGERVGNFMLYRVTLKPEEEKKEMKEKVRKKK